MLITSLIVLWNTGPPTQDSPTYGKNYAIKLEKKNDWKDAFVDIMSLIFQRICLNFQSGYFSGSNISRNPWWAKVIGEALQIDNFDTR